MSEAGKKAMGGGKSGLVLLLVAAIVMGSAMAYRMSDAENAATDAISGQSAQISIEQLRAEAGSSGDDARPWQQLGFAHFQRGEFAEAATAYERAVAIDPEEAVLWSALGEAKVMASQRDPMPAEALRAFKRASELDPGDPRARYFLNVQKDLEGDHDGAIIGWLALLAQTPRGAPWERDLVRTIEQVGAINAIEVDDRIAVAQSARGGSTIVGPTRGPTQAQIAAAGAIPPSEQRAMAEGMVERLEQRLKADPSDLEGWVMLMRSRMTLGEAGKANEALQAAIAANPASSARLREEAASLGVR